MIIALTGPESCGKTQLAEQLSVQLGLPIVYENARTYLYKGQPKPHYQPSDLVALLKLQIACEEGVYSCVLDTDLLTLIIWWREKYGPIPDIFQTAFKSQTPRHYLLCEPDIAWQPDVLRENPHDRKRLFEVYQRELKLRNLPYDVVRGDGRNRFDCAVVALKKVPAKAQ